MREERGKGREEGKAGAGVVCVVDAAAPGQMLLSIVIMQCLS
jgi:hypothetical protein